MFIEYLLLRKEYRGWEKFFKWKVVYKLGKKLVKVVLKVKRFCLSN